MNNPPQELKPSDPLKIILRMRVWIPDTDRVSRILSRRISVKAKGIPRWLVCRRTAYVLDAGIITHAHCFGVN